MEVDARVCRPRPLDVDCFQQVELEKPCFDGGLPLRSALTSAGLVSAS